MKCTKCGQELEENAVKCDACGTTVIQDNAEQPEVLPEEAPQDQEPQIEGSAETEELTEEQLNIDTEVKKQKIINFQLIKKHWLKIVLGVVVIILIAYMSKYYQIEEQLSNAGEEYEALEKEYDNIHSENKTLNKTVEELQDEIEELKNGAATQLTAIKNAFEEEKWSDVITLTDTLHKKYNGSKEDKEAQELAKQSQAKIDEAKAAEEAKKAKGYETGITYDQLAREPDKYKGEKVKFSGKVIQVMEDSPTIKIRLAVNDNYDTVLYGSYYPNIVSTRVLEDDHITVFGTSEGTISYQSTLGGTITIPGVSIEKINQ